MKKYGYFFIYLGLNVLLLSVFNFSDIKSSRNPSSVNISTVTNCFKKIGSFFKKPVLKEDVYTQYLEAYKISKPTVKKKFDSIEDYAAWIDWRVSIDEFSVAKHYLTPGLMAKIKSYKLDFTRPDHFMNFFFNSILDGIIKDSIRIEGLDKAKHIFLKSFLTRKLADEALSNFYEPVGRRSLWSRMMATKTAKTLGNVISYAPLAFGFPPLKLPNFMLKSEKALLSSKSVKEAIDVYGNFSPYKKSSLAFKVSYDHFKKYYVLGVAAYYYYFTYLDFEQVSNNEIVLNQINDELDESTQQLSELITPTCQSVINCLEEYRLEWNDENNDRYYEYKNTCKEVYGVKEDC